MLIHHQIGHVIGFAGFDSSPCFARDVSRRTCLRTVDVLGNIHSRIIRRRKLIKNNDDPFTHYRLDPNQVVAHACIEDFCKTTKEAFICQPLDLNLAHYSKNGRMNFLPLRPKVTDRFISFRTTVPCSISSFVTQMN